VGSPSNTMWPGLRPTSIVHAKWHPNPSNRLASATIHQRRRQQSDRIRRTVFTALTLYIIKTYACVKCTYTVRECLLLPRDAARPMLARSWES